MKTLAITLGLIALAMPLHDASAQTLNARRMGMGGVVLPGGMGDEFNVAYRAVPKAPGSSVGFALPIGLVPLIADPPVLDPDDPEFNIYELANTLYNPPWNLQLVSPKVPSNDIVVELGKDHLAVQLGEIGDLFPEEGSRVEGVVRGPSLGFGFRQFFGGVSAIAHYQNRLALNQPLHAALASGEAFQPNTEYALYDDAVGQAAAQLELGWASRVFASGDLRRREGSAVYAGARTKLMRGLAYGDAENVVSFTTLDTLFSSAPIDLDYTGFLRQAGPGGGGFGSGLDLGAVWVVDGFEIGVGVNDAVSRLDWKVEESVAFRDTSANDFARVIVGEEVPFTSRIPATVTVNVASRIGIFLLAADVVHGMSRTAGHCGAETWLGLVALRTGASIDANRKLQFGGGCGVKLGRFGVDLAVASNSRNLARERGLELSAGLALYR